MTEELLTAEEAAGMLRISPSTISAMCRDGRLPRIRSMRHIRIPRWAVEEMMGDYDFADEPDREARAEAPQARRGDGRPSQAAQAGGRDAPRAVAPVGGGGALDRRVGTAPGDVVVRRVPR